MLYVNQFQVIEDLSSYDIEENPELVSVVIEPLTRLSIDSLRLIVVLLSKGFQIIIDNKSEEDRLLKKAFDYAFYLRDCVSERKDVQMKSNKYVQVSDYITEDTIMYIQFSLLGAEVKISSTKYCGSKQIEQIEKDKGIVYDIGALESDYYYLNPNARWQVTQEHVILNHVGLSMNINEFEKLLFMLKNGVKKSDILSVFKGTIDEETWENLEQHNTVLQYGDKVEKLFTKDHMPYAKQYSNYLRYLLQFEEMEYLKKQVCESIEPLYFSDEIIFEKNEILPEEYLRRKSYRTFSKKEIKKNTLGKVLAGLTQKKDKSFCYPVSGGLYSQQIYIYIKGNRVQDVNEGLYFFDKVNESLKCISKEVVDDQFHFAGNRTIFNESAFTIFIVENVEQKMKKYGAKGMQYSLIDAGIMTQTITMLSECYGLGVCSIGTWASNPIKEYLGNVFELVHIIECGLKCE